MKKFIRIISMTLCMLLCFSMVQLPAAAATTARYELPFEVNARAYVLASLDTGEIIFEKNSNERYDPASLTKLLTAYTTYKYVEDFEGTKVTAPRYVYDELFGMNSSTADIRQGEILHHTWLQYHFHQML